MLFVSNLIEFFTIGNSAKSDTSKSELRSFAFLDMRYSLRYIFLEEVGHLKLPLAVKFKL